MGRATTDNELRDYFGNERIAVGTNSEITEMGFGEYLVDQMAITRSQLFQALSLQDRSPEIKLGECIAALGYLPHTAVDNHINEWESIEVIEL